MNQSEAIKLLNAACMRLFGCNMDEATDKQAYKALCTVIRNAMYDRRRAFKRSYQDDGRKQVYYMSMEFLVGTSLHNNLYNLGWEKVFTDALKKLDIDIHDLYALDPDAGLGNGGLGRLASCYLDARVSDMSSCWTHGAELEGVSHLLDLLLWGLLRPLSSEWPTTSRLLTCSKSQPSSSPQTWSSPLFPSQCCPCSPH